MPQIGWFEILIIVVLAILIIGPKDFPIMLKKIGSWVGSFKNYFSEIQRDISDMEDSIEEDIFLDTEMLFLLGMKTMNFPGIESLPVTLAPFLPTGLFLT